MPKPSVREKLVETALERFQEQGFNGCGVQDITDAAGVPKGSFYNHFKSKESLALEVLDRYGQSCRFEMLADVEAPPLDRLRAHFRFLAERFEGWHFARGCLLGTFGAETADTNPVMREAMAASLDRWANAIAALLREAREKHDLDPNLDPAETARFVIAAWEGAVTCAKIAKSQGAIDDFFAVMFGSLLTGRADG